MLHKSTLLALFGGALLLSTSTWAGPREIWSSRTPSTLPVPLGVRIQRAGGTTARIITRDGAGVAFLSVRCDPFAGGKTVPADQEMSTSEGDVHFTPDGSLALVKPLDGDPYVLAFDIDRGAFLNEPPYRFRDRPKRWILGPSRVVAFIGSGAESEYLPPKQLQIEMITHDQAGFHPVRIWETGLYTVAISADVNARGDVVALLGACRTTSVVPPKQECGKHLLLVLRSDGKMLHQELPRALFANAVAVSESGRWVAHFSRQDELSSVRIYDGETLSQHGPPLVMDGCITDARISTAIALDINDEKAVAATIVAWYGSPPGLYQVLVVPPGGRCERAAALPYDVKEVATHLFGSKYLYVGTVSRSGPAGSTASVYEIE